MEKANPFKHCYKELDIEGTKFSYYSIKDLKDPRVETLPFSIRVLLESAIRNCDEFNVKCKISFIY